MLYGIEIPTELHLEAFIALLMQYGKEGTTEWEEATHYPDMVIVFDLELESIGYAYTTILPTVEHHLVPREFLTTLLIKGVMG